MPAPSAAIIDNFNRADQTPPSGDWATTMIQSTNTTHLQIVSNGLGVTDGANTNSYLNTSYGPDCEMYCSPVSFSGIGAYLGLFLRIASPADPTWSGYYLIWVKGSPNDSWIVRKRVGGTATDLNTFTSASIASSGDKIAFQAAGSALRCYKNSSSTWSQVGTDVTDTDITAAGKFGMELGTAGGSVSVVDDLGGGTLGTPGTTYTKTGLGIVGP